MIPGNDDAIRAVKLISATMANAIIEGKEGQMGAAEAKPRRTRRTKKPLQNKQNMDSARHARRRAVRGYRLINLEESLWHLLQRTLRPSAREPAAA